MTYDIILADPPWTYGYNKAAAGSAKAGRGCANSQYSLLKNSDIAKMPIQELSDPNGCILFLWSSFALLEDCMAVQRGWGFKHKSGMVWTKGCKSDFEKDKSGVGFWFRSNAEPMLLGVSGRKPMTRRTNAVNHMRTEQLGHSVKPDTLQDIIDKTWPDARKLELFARRNRPGWDAWGNHEGLECAAEPLQVFGGTHWEVPTA